MISFSLVEVSIQFLCTIGLDYSSLTRVTSSVGDGTHVTFCFGSPTFKNHDTGAVTSSSSSWSSFTDKKGTLQNNGLYFSPLFDCIPVLSLLRFSAEFHPSFRWWSGFRGLGVLWTSELTHPEPGPFGSWGAPVHRLLLHQSRLQPLQVNDRSLSLSDLYPSLLLTASVKSCCLFFFHSAVSK